MTNPPELGYTLSFFHLISFLINNHIMYYVSIFAKIELVYVKIKLWKELILLTQKEL